MIATNIFYNFVGFRYSPPLTAIFLTLAAIDDSRFVQVASLGSHEGSGPPRGLDCNSSVTLKECQTFSPSLYNYI